MKREHTKDDKPCGAAGCNGAQHLGTGPNGDHQWCPIAVRRARAAHTTAATLANMREIEGETS